MTQMRAVEIVGKGGPEVLRETRRPVPVPGSSEVLIRVEAAGLNGADLAQRRGVYPAPKGASDLPGLEVAGTVAALGPEAHGVTEGDRVCALLPSGGYAEYCTVAASHTLPLPANVGAVEAAGLIEALVTVHANVFMDARLVPGETLLIHGGTSGIGTTAIQLARLAGCRVAVTVGSELKAAAAIIAFAGGRMGELDLARVMMNRLQVTGSTLRARSTEEKAVLVEAVKRQHWPFVVDGRFRPRIDGTFALADAAKAHERMESSEHIGKIILEVA